MKNFLKYLKAILFADDSTAYGLPKSLSTLVRNTQDNLNKLNDWLCVNKLSLNILDKTNFIVLSLKPLTDPINIEINGTRVNRELSTKFLGVYIDQTLNWGEHCKNCNVLNAFRILFSNRSANESIAGVSTYTHTGNLFSRNKILKLGDIYRLHLGEFMYSQIHNIGPTISLFHYAKIMKSTHTIHAKHHLYHRVGKQATSFLYAAPE